MEPAMEPETLEARINRATNPLNKELDWASINGFCEQLNEDFEGPPLATRLLAHKIQSPQEWEAIQALTVRRGEATIHPPPCDDTKGGQD
uniref:Golgi-associated, gamma adaptin ear containing, ARF binding protein 1 n=1 Tax=Pan troglodytes TaxID=9598 RepID=K7B7R5_PANTR